MPAPNLDRSALATALRADDDDTDIAVQLDRILETAIALVSSVTDAAPQAVANEAAIRIGAWLYDTDPASPRNGDPVRASGAAQLLARWRSTALVEPGQGLKICLGGLLSSVSRKPGRRATPTRLSLPSSLRRLGSGSHDVALTAAAEIARSQWGRAFSAARSDVLDPATLEMIGRALVSPGEIVFLRARGSLIPVASHEVYGIGAAPADWRYRIQINAPVGQLTREVGYGDVCHIRLRATPEAPWQGRSAWAACPTTAALAARIEISLSNEQRSGVGSVVAVPDAAKADSDGVTTALANARGSILLGDSAASQDAGTGRGASGREWQPTRFGPNPPAVKLSYAAVSGPASSQRQV